MDRNCKDCGTTIRGRSDKKFCDDQCRSNYNNKIRSENLSLVKQIDQTLKRNRLILMKFNPTGKTKVKRNDLIKNGFDFNYFTHIQITSKGTNYIFCYEYGYLQIDADFILIVKKDNS